MIDILYRQFTKDTVTLKGINDHLLYIKSLESKYKHRYWLHLMGLIETMIITSKQ